MAEFNLLKTLVRKIEHCTNCAIVPRPLSRYYLCENSASLLFHSSAGQRLQFLKKIYLLENKMSSASSLRILRILTIVVIGTNEVNVIVIIFMNDPVRQLKHSILPDNSCTIKLISLFKILPIACFLLKPELVNFI